MRGINQMAMLGFGFTLNPSNKTMNKTKAESKMAKIMREYKEGKLKSGIDPKGPKKAKTVKSRKQAIAIALAVSGMGKKMMKKGKK
jgi:hypothetical protein